MRKLLIIITLCFLASCANPINRHTGMNYNDWGGNAETAGDYTLAERNYSRALMNFQIGYTGDADVSMALYNLGRVKGYLCKYGEAESLLLEALQLEEKVTGPESAVTSMRVFELARLSFDRQQFEKAVIYYSRGIPLVRKLGAENKDPIALADAIDEYSSSLTQTGASDKARAASQEANALRANNPEKKARFVPVRYKNKCM